MATAHYKRFPRVPYHAIFNRVGTYHVSKPDAEVAEDIRSRLAKTSATPREIEESVRYAIAVHHDNLKLYCQVMSGHIG